MNEKKSYKSIKLQVTAPNAKVVGEEMIVSVNLPNGTPVQVTLTPQIRPNETTIVPVSVPSDSINGNFSSSGGTSPRAYNCIHVLKIHFFSKKPYH